MNIEEYLSELNEECQNVFAASLTFRKDLGKVHHISACIHEFAQNIPEESEQNVLNIVSSQIEASTLSASMGMYRQAFASLRLALEMGLATAHFSAHRLDFHEWLDGRRDIKWATIIDQDEGVLSARFAKAFFPEFSADTSAYRSQAIELYRKLSEFVHGNSDTWIGCGTKISFSEENILSYFKSASSVGEVILFVIACRYLKTFSPQIRETMEFIPEEMNHLDYVREYFGRQ